jgi:hypothetical protein
MIRSLIKPVLLGAAVLAASGCAGGITPVTGTSTFGSAYSVTVGQTWSDVSTLMPVGRNVRVWTLDGHVLNRLYLAHDIEPGAGLLPRPRGDQRIATFREDMTSRELIELLTESIAAVGLFDVEPQRLEPGRLGVAQGVSFAFTAQTREGLAFSGHALAAVNGGKLQAVIYMAASEHYFEAHRAEVERIFSGLAGAPLRIGPGPQPASAAPAPTIP